MSHLRVLRCGGERFCHLLRVFETHSIGREIRSAVTFGVGDFYIGDTQTILGPAVIDAATWYQKRRLDRDSGDASR